MQFSSLDIGLNARIFLPDMLQESNDYLGANQRLKAVCGVSDFFETSEDFEEFRRYLTEKQTLVKEPDRAEYGDFQTNRNLADRIAMFLNSDGYSPDVLIEPTFGKGNFILAALQYFPQLRQIKGVEIYKPYVWEAKFSILNFFLQNPDRAKPDIQLFHQDVFGFDFIKMSRDLATENVLILGNPPWVTSAKLGAMDSANLPVKSNYKNLNGFDAITGKGNFDLGEYITSALLRAFQNHAGWMAFLVKNSVIKNIVFDQKSAKLRIAQLRHFPIDAKKEFGVSVEAALFCCRLNQPAGSKCARVEMIHSAKPNFYFGWQGNQFVANIEKYESSRTFDGTCPFEWRQGMKHDCSEIMELRRVNGHFQTNREDEVQLENDLVYGILKSSDLKGGMVDHARRFTIVTQQKIGQDTAYIQSLFPKTYSYLHKHREIFTNRKSSIYRGKPPFSIFGIGDYSFSPFKVAISGLYKSPVFTLVLPENNKPLMLDDTCYFIGFDKFKDALIAFALLNHPLVTGLLDAITFPDAKRTFTKDVLMRINLKGVANAVGLDGLTAFFANMDVESTLDEADFAAFLQRLTPAGSAQIQLELI